MNPLCAPLSTPVPSLCHFPKQFWKVPLVSVFSWTTVVVLMPALNQDFAFQGNLTLGKNEMALDARSRK